MTVEELAYAITTYQHLRQRAPAWVGDQLRDHNQAARHHLQQARLLAAQARAESDAQHQNDLLAQGTRHQDRSEGHARKAEQLVASDRLRVQWYEATEPARQAAGRAASELRRRGLDHSALPAIDIRTGEALANNGPNHGGPSLVSIAFPHNMRTTLAMAAAQAETARRTGAQPERERPAPSRNPTQAKDHDYGL